MATALPSRFNRSLLSDNTERRFGFRRPSFSSDRPAGPAEGDAFYELNTDKFYIWNGSVWVQQIASGAWDTFTPVPVSGITLGAGTRIGRWTRFGRTIVFHAQFTLGAGSAVAQPVQWQPPVSFQTASGFIIGDAWYLDAAVQEYPGNWRLSGANALILNQAIAGNIAVNVPFTWGSGDVMAWSGTYEAAASV